MLGRDQQSSRNRQSRPWATSRRGQVRRALVNQNAVIQIGKLDTTKLGYFLKRLADGHPAHSDRTSNGSLRLARLPEQYPQAQDRAYRAYYAIPIKATPLVRPRLDQQTRDRRHRNAESSAASTNSLTPTRQPDCFPPSGYST